jgi:hypothetical protein
VAWAIKRSRLWQETVIKQDQWVVADHQVQVDVVAEQADVERAVEVQAELVVDRVEAEVALKWELVQVAVVEFVVEVAKAVVKMPVLQVLDVQLIKQN